MKAQAPPARLSAEVANGGRLGHDRPGQQLLVTAVIVATWTAFDFINPFFPLYVRELGVSDLAEAALWSGVLVGISPLLSAVASPIWGVIADRAGLRSALLPILAVFTVFLFLMAIVATPLELLGLRVIMGFASGFTTLAMALASAGVPRDQVGRAIGRFQTIQSAALTIVPVLGGWLIDQVGIRANFFLASGLLLVTTIVFALGYRDAGRISQAQPRGASRPSPGLRQLLWQPWMLAIFAVLFATQFVDNSLLPVLPLLVVSFQGQSGQIGTLVGIIVASGPAAAAIAPLVVGRLLAGKVEARLLMMVALPAGALLCLGLVFATGVVHVLLLRAGIGLFYGALMTIGYTAGRLATSQERAATAFGAMGAVGFLGRAAGPFVAGVVATVDFRLVFLLDAALFAIALLAVVLWLRSHASSIQG